MSTQGTPEEKGTVTSGKSLDELALEAINVPTSKIEAREEKQSPDDDSEDAVTENSESPDSDFELALDNDNIEEESDAVVVNDEDFYPNDSVIPSETGYGNPVDVAIWAGLPAGMLWWLGTMVLVTTCKLEIDNFKSAILARAEDWTITIELCVGGYVLLLPFSIYCRKRVPLALAAIWPFGYGMIAGIIATRWLFLWVMSFF